MWVLLAIHIVTAYGWTHDWSHSKAVEHVAERTKATIELSEAMNVAGLGIYANFLVLIVWSWVAFARPTNNSSMHLRTACEVFLWLMFISASILFAKPESAIFFAALMALVGLVNFWSNQISPKNSRV